MMVALVIAGAVIAIVSLCIGVLIGYRLQQGRQPFDIAIPLLDALLDDMPSPFKGGHYDVD